MARARRSTGSQTSQKTSGTGDAMLRCPECGKTFTRAASLGAHRNRAHGVAGTSNAARRNSRRGTSARSTSRRDGAGGQTKPQSTRGRGRTSSSGGGSSVNRDALLQALFPNGVPAREAVIRRANAWLDEAEQLARAK